MLDAGGLDESTSILGQLERLAPVVAESGLDRRQAFPDLNHAAGALVAPGKRSAGVEGDQARPLAQPRMTLAEGERPELTSLPAVTMQR